MDENNCISGMVSEVQPYRSNLEYLYSKFEMIDALLELINKKSRCKYLVKERIASEEKEIESVEYQIKNYEDKIYSRKLLSLENGVELQFDRFIEKHKLNDVEEKIVLYLLRMDARPGVHRDSGADILEIVSYFYPDFIDARKYLYETSNLRQKNIIGRDTYGRGTLLERKFFIKEWAIREIYSHTMDEKYEDNRSSSDDKILLQTEPQIRLNEIVLSDKQHELIKQTISQITHHKLIFDKWGFGRRYKTNGGVTILFTGPSGTGKTITAEAIAKELNKKLYIVNYSQVVSMWFGQLEKNMAKVFKKAKEDDGVLLFDEADALLSKRTTISNSVSSSLNRAVNIALQETEKFNGIIIFTTNLSTNLDRAFERRINLKIKFDLPDESAREKIWRMHIPENAPVSKDVNLKQLAKKYVFSGGNIKNAVLTAARIAANRKDKTEKTEISQSDFEEACKLELAGSSVMEYDIGTDNKKKKDVGGYA